MTRDGRYGLRYVLLMLSLPLHLMPGFGVATVTLVGLALAWLYRTRAQETGQTRTAGAAMIAWTAFGVALHIGSTGRWLDVTPIPVARAAFILAVPALGLNWLCSAALWRGWTPR
jgi:hypothetical protein